MHGEMVRTPNRLTVMMPIVQKKSNNWTEDEIGNQLVHNILVRKGNERLLTQGGKMKPMTQLIFSRAMTRLRSNEDPRLIVRDLESQLLLV